MAADSTARTARAERPDAAPVSAAVQILDKDPHRGSPPGQPGADGRHRGGQKRGGHANHHLGSPPPTGQQLQAESHLHCCPPNPRQVSWHMMAETTNDNAVRLLLGPESGTGVIPLPLWIVRVTGQDLHVVSTLSQACREPGRVRGDSGRLGGVVNPEDCDSDRSTGHVVESSRLRARRWGTRSWSAKADRPDAHGRRLG
jgi:hypothetical protein